MYIYSEEIPSKKEWTDKDFDKVLSYIRKHFNNKSFKNHRNEKVFMNVDPVEFLGCPFTSCTDPIISLDCNVHLYLNYSTYNNYHYNYIYLSDNGHIVIACSDENENYIYLAECNVLNINH